MICISFTASMLLISMQISFFASTCWACWHGPFPSLLNDEIIQMNILPFYTSIDSVCFWSCVAMGMQVQLMTKTMVLSQSNSAQDFGFLASLHQWMQAENTRVLWKLEQKMLGSKWISRLYCQLPIKQHKAFSVHWNFFQHKRKKRNGKFSPCANTEDC